MIIDPHTDALIEKYRRTGVLVDANLLLVLVLGLYRPSSISSHPHTSDFDERDFKFLDWFVALFPAILSTPNVLTEVSNLAGKLDKRYWPAFRERFGAMIRLIDERFCESKAAAGNRHFAALGLTDAAILGLGAGNFLLLTADFALAGVATESGIDVLNYNHLRPLVWQLKF